MSGKSFRPTNARFTNSMKIVTSQKQMRQLGI